jgi:AcrR family transcriptional regulator
MARPLGHRAKQEQKLLDLITALSRKRPYCNASTNYLAKKLGVSERTISRYISSLRKQGRLNAFYRRMLTKDGWQCQRYCRPYSIDCQKTWAPVYQRPFAPKPVAEKVQNTQPVCVPGGSWAKPWYGEEDLHPTVLMSALDAKIAAYKALPKPVVDPRAEALAQSRYWMNEAELARKRGR